MCAQITQRPRVTPQAWKKVFQVDAPLDFNPERNIFPLEPIAAIRTSPVHGGRESLVFNWGLNPAWSRDPRFGRHTYNARSETVAEKPSFKQAFRKRRCLVPADSFYEWSPEKRLFRISRVGGGQFAFAGLWEWNASLKLLTCTVLTSAPNPLIAAVGHDRTPVILEPGQFEPWLDPRLDEPEVLKTFLEPYQGTDLEIERVEKK
jgi:putative SOS response-associated peptidase YedK